MKVSEVIEELEVGETVWVKATVDRINNEGKYIRVMPNASFVYLDGHDEISLTEPQTEKVEVPDYVAEWYESHENNLNQAIYDATIDSYDHRHKTEFEEWFIDSRNDTYGTLIRMKDGYTVKSKRWVVTTADSDTCYLKRFRVGKEYVEEGISKVWVGDLKQAFTFDDRAKAEAVATLVEGTVEEV